MMSIAEIYAELTAPFPPELIDIKPGATTGDKTRALAMAYADTRVYQERLDTIVGPDNWQVEYRQLGDRSVICRLTILGVVREDVGESDNKDENAATAALAQSFKRACSCFGLGRYLYNLQRIWVAYDADKKCITDPDRAVHELYRRAGLLPRAETASTAAARPTTPQAAPSGAAARPAAPLGRNGGGR